MTQLKNKGRFISLAGLVSLVALSSAMACSFDPRELEVRPALDDAAGDGDAPGDGDGDGDGGGTGDGDGVTCKDGESGDIRLDSPLRAAEVFSDNLTEVSLRFSQSLAELEMTVGLNVDSSQSMDARVDSVIAAVQANVSAHATGFSIRSAESLCYVDDLSAAIFQSECESELCGISAPSGGLAGIPAGECDGDCLGECAGACDGAIECNSLRSECAGRCEGGCQLSTPERCDGICRGTCTGSCVGKQPDGSCDGECDGDCTGECINDGGQACAGECLGNCAELSVSDSCPDGEFYSCGQGVECEGTCSGGCYGKFEAERTAVDCDEAEDCSVLSALVAASFVRCDNLVPVFGYEPNGNGGFDVFLGQMGTVFALVSEVLRAHNGLTAMTTGVVDQVALNDEPPLLQFLEELDLVVNASEGKEVFPGVSDEALQCMQPQYSSVTEDLLEQADELRAVIAAGDGLYWAMTTGFLE